MDGYAERWHNNSTRFPWITGTVTGLVGALGGLGGFFPPLLLGVFRDRLGVLWPGFLLLSATALCLRYANQRVFRPADVAWTQSLSPGRAPRARACPGRALGGALDGGVGDRDCRGLPAARAFRRGAGQLHVRDAVCRVRHHLPLRDVAQPAADAHVLAAGMAGVLLRARARRRTPSRSAAARVVEFAANRYIFRRGVLRGLAHWLIMWGCVLAAAITFPLVWGWIHFETVPGDLHLYRTFVFGIPVQDFPVDSVVAFVIFHGLVWSSFLVIAGVMLAFRRRMIDHGAVAVQQFGQDILPLLLLSRSASPA